MEAAAFAFKSELLPAAGWQLIDKSSVQLRRWQAYNYQMTRSGGQRPGTDPKNNYQVKHFYDIVLRADSLGCHWAMMMTMMMMMIILERNQFPKKKAWYVYVLPIAFVVVVPLYNTSNPDKCLLIALQRETQTLCPARRQSSRPSSNLVYFRYLAIGMRWSVHSIYRKSHLAAPLSSFSLTTKRIYPSSIISSWRSP